MGLRQMRGSGKSGVGKQESEGRELFEWMVRMNPRDGARVTARPAIPPLRGIYLGLKNGENSDVSGCGAFRGPSTWTGRPVAIVVRPVELPESSIQNWSASIRLECSLSDSTGMEMEIYLTTRWISTATRKRLKSWWTFLRFPSELILAMIHLDDFSLRTRSADWIIRIAAQRLRVDAAPP